MIVLSSKLYPMQNPLSEKTSPNVSSAANINVLEAVPFFLLGLLMQVALPALATEPSPPADDAVISAPSTAYPQVSMLPPNLGEIQVTPTRIPIGRSVTVTVTLPIRVPNYAPSNVVLQRLNAKNFKPVVTLAQFHDDGNQGDAVASDGIYTVRTELISKQPAKIFLGATATFYDPDPQVLASLPMLVVAKSGASDSGAWAVVEGKRVLFRDHEGRTIRKEENIDTPSVALGTDAKAQVAQLFTQQEAIVSPDRTHVGVVGALRPNTAYSAKTDDRALSGWEFRYQDVTGTLWTKTIANPERSFYLPGSSRLISEDGGRVLLIEVGEDADEPRLAVYDRTGVALMREKVALYAMEDAQISSNGRYVLLKGLSLTPKQDFVKLIVIDVDNPTQRWVETYHGARINAEQIEENRQGGFDIWLNERKRYSFPK